jgi:hypothetical protein
MTLNIAYDNSIKPVRLSSRVTKLARNQRLNLTVLMKRQLSSCLPAITHSTRLSDLQLLFVISSSLRISSRLSPRHYLFLISFFLSRKS